MTIGIRDADLIFPQALLLNMREVPSCYDSLANNTTKGLQSGSILSVKKPTCLPTIGLLLFIVKQVPRQPGLYLKQEPNVKTLLPDIKMMESHTRLTVPFAASKQLSLSANPNHLKTERSESNLHLCGECWPNSSKFSSLMEMTKVHLSSQRSTPAHKFSALRREETALENQCSNLHLFGSGQLFTLVAPDLSVPGISPEVLQRVLSQANRPHV